MADLATGAYSRDGRTIIINGPTGTGKSYFGCALGERACREGIKTLYFTMNTLVENMRLVHLEERETNFFRKLPVTDWYDVFQSELIAEACLDRLVHKSKRFQYEGESLRKNINFAADTEDQQPSERVSPELLNGYRRNTHTNQLSDYPKMYVMLTDVLLESSSAWSLEPIKR